MPVAFSYVRFSSLKQQHGDSFKRQTDMVAAWLFSHPDCTLSPVDYHDLGKSGFTGAHLENAFGRLRAAVSSGIIKPGDFILIEAIDRAGRLAPSIMLNLLTEIVNAGVSLVSLDDGIVYNSDPHKSNNLFLLVAKVQQAYQYSDTLSRRIKSAYERKREDARSGVSVGRYAPIWIKKEYPNGKKAPPVVSLHEEIAPLVVQAFEDYADGLGERRIHNRLQDQHPAFEKMSKTTLKRWMSNPTAIGYWKEIPDVYPPVVSKELWYRVQKRLNRPQPKRTAATKHLLVGIVKCARCGSNFHMMDKPGYSSMGCGRRHRYGARGCTNAKSIPTMVLEFVRHQTAFEPLKRASMSRNLTTSEKRELEIDGELAELQRQAATAAEGAVKYGMAAFGSVLDKVTTLIKELEQERLVLAATPAPSSDWAMMELQEDLAIEDDVRLNALLQEAGYIISCNERVITVAEPSFEYGGVTQVIEYLGKDRVDGLFRIRWNGHGFAIPDLESAPQRAEFNAAIELNDRLEAGELEYGNWCWDKKLRKFILSDDV